MVMSMIGTTRRKRRGTVLTIFNQKGGVGKTTTAVNVSAALAAANFRVLLIDLDSQGNASTALGIDRTSRGLGAYDFLLGADESAATVRETAIPGLSLVTGSMDLVGAEMELSKLGDRHAQLADRLKPIRDEYDFILVDCPPSFGFLALNAILAADRLLVPVQCEYLSLEGLSHLRDTVNLLRQRFVPGFTGFDILVTMYEQTNPKALALAGEMRRHFAGSVYETMVPRNEAISEAAAFGTPVLLYRPDSDGADAYLHVSAEILIREGVEVAVPVDRLYHAAYADDGSASVQPMPRDESDRITHDMRMTLETWFKRGVYRRAEKEPAVVAPVDGGGSAVELPARSRTRRQIEAQELLDAIAQKAAALKAAQPEDEPAGMAEPLPVGWVQRLRFARPVAAPLIFVGMIAVLFALQYLFNRAPMP